MRLADICGRQRPPLPFGVWPLLFAQYCLCTFTAISFGALFDAYLLVLHGSNTFVGSVATAGGVAAVAVAIPAGWALDKWNKPVMLRWNLIAGILAVLALAASVPVAFTPLVVASSVLAALHMQFFGVTVPVLITELTTAGDERTRAFGNSQSSLSLGQATGPAIQLAFTYILGTDEWTIDQLRWVLLIGIALFFPYSWQVWRVKQGCDVNLAERTRLLEVSMTEAPLNANTELPSVVAVDSDGQGVEDHVESGAQDVAANVDAPGASHAKTAGDAETNSLPSDVDESTPRSHWIVAVLLELTGFFTAVGSGMTFKFWPLFFKEDFGFNPAQVCMMQLGIWLAIAVAAQFVGSLARVMGRLPAIIVTHYGGTAFLFVISLVSFPTPVTVVLVIVRNALMNMNNPLLQSCLMDVVPAKHRGKWTAFMSLKRMTWSGSAFVGGWLSDQRDYRFAFLITACFHMLSGSFLLLVPCFKKF